MRKVQGLAKKEKLAQFTIFISIAMQVVVAYLALDELGLDSRPSLRLSGVGEKVHNNGTA